MRLRVFVADVLFVPDVGFQWGIGTAPEALVDLEELALKATEFA